MRMKCFISKYFLLLIILQIVNEFKGHDDCKVYSVVCNSDLNPFVLKVINLTNMCIDKVQNYVLLSNV